MKEYLSDDLKEKYDALKIPTIYEFVIKQEKVSSEIRRQNKEINNLSQILEKIHNFIEDLTFEKTKKTNEDFLEENLEFILDLILSFRQLVSSFLDLEKILPVKQTSIFSFIKEKKQPSFKKCFSSYLEGLQLIHEKLLNKVSSYNISIIDPQIEELFDPQLHRAIETKNQGKEGKIEKVFSCGFKRGDSVIRFANVIVK